MRGYSALVGALPHATQASSDAQDLIDLRQTNTDGERNADSFAFSQHRARGRCFAHSPGTAES
jgi:hypothetical protein